MLKLSAVALAFLSVLSATATAADAQRGQRLWEGRCTGCHSLDEDRIGPRHRGVFGRKAGSAPEFTYSQAVKNAGFTWDEVKLDAWLSNPQALLPGQRMNFRVAKADDRADIIAYLKSLSGPSKP
jgi:cytochrome c